MEARAVLAFVRKLCDDIDAARPLRYGVRSVILPLAVPTALGLGLGAGGCVDSTPADDPEQICDDGIDDDGDGDVDCDDVDCEADEGCQGVDPACEPRREYCEDGVDNDGNGDLDCADLCCDAFCFARDCPMCEYGVPFEPLDAEVDCADSRDEDCDGQTDCCDPDCGADPVCAG